MCVTDSLLCWGSDGDGSESSWKAAESEHEDEAT